MSYKADYLPSDGVDKSKGGFVTREAAWEYVYSQMCASCQEEREAALTGAEWEGYQYENEDGTIGYTHASSHPGCAFEWDVFDEATGKGSIWANLPVYVRPGYDPPKLVFQDGEWRELKIV